MTHFTGTFAVAQLIIRHCNLPWHDFNNWRLDNEYPYTSAPSGHYDVPSHAMIYGLGFADAPSVTGIMGAYCADQFKDYFVFNPDTAGSIYVSLGVSYWSWYGSAVYAPITSFNSTGWNWVGVPQFWSSQSIQVSTEQPVWGDTESSDRD
jgi:hypothetical protein